ncbi:hypothetical protein [Pseudomonas sp. 58(2021)]|nr:hypothetical protein [Pseudomonas sp. 58(2021)]
MNRSDETPPGTITVLDQPAFASRANLAASPMKVYQQGFIQFECLS